jgi:peptidyl-prolyl cis-trans isomerase C
MPTPKHTRSVCTALVALGVLGLGAGTAALAQTQLAPGGDAVVARSSIERRMADVPPHQLRVLGSTAAEVRRAFVDVVIGEQVLSQGARAEGLERRADVQSRLQGVLRSALLTAVRAELGDGSDIPESEVKAFYQQNPSRYQADKRLHLWQIVVPTGAEAAKLLSVIREDPDYRKDPVKGWAALAQKYSTDESTKQRHGNLGPVGPDGSTKRAGVTVNPALYQAAEKVKDGEVVATPIQDGDHFVIVQRRGISDSPARGLETEAPLIRSQLLQRRYQERVRELLAELRRRVRIESYPERVDMLDVVAARDGEVVSSRRPGGLPRERHPSESQPRPIGPPGKAR